MQKTNKEIGPALVGIELEKKEEYNSLIQRLKNNDIKKLFELIK